MPERSIGIVCKTIALTGYPGSNPGPDTNVESPALLRMRDRSTGSFVYRNTLFNQSSSGPDTKYVTLLQKPCLFYPSCGEARFPNPFR